MAKLRSMKASVRCDDVYLRNNTTGEMFKIDNGIVLTSYNSVVAVWDDEDYTLYCLPRYDYSVTTWKHIHAFIDDYTHLPHNWGAKEIRQSFKDYENGKSNDIIYCDEISHNAQDWHTF